MSYRFDEQRKPLALVAAALFVVTGILGGACSSTEQTAPIPNGATAASALYEDPCIPSTPPVLTLNGAAERVVECQAGSVYTDPGAHAVDGCAHPVPVRSFNSGSDLSGPGPNLTAEGTYPVTYLAVDGQGNAATAQRWITVDDRTPPVLTLQGSLYMTHTCGSAWVDPGWTATDACYGDLTPTVRRTGGVNGWGRGVYTLTYSVMDSGGISASPLTRIVEVGACPWDPPPPQPGPLSQGGFETPDQGAGFYDAFAFQPSGSAWRFEGNTGLAGNGSGFTDTNSNAPEGDQVAFIQAALNSVMSQSFSNPPGSYRITLKAAQRVLHGVVNTQIVSVRLDGVELYRLNPLSISYDTYATPPFALGAGAHELKLVGLNPLGGDNTVFIDDLRLEPVTLPPPTGPLSQGGFETPDQGTGFYDAFAFQPSGSAWTFEGNTGLAGNGSGFTDANPNAPEGDQVAFIQADRNSVVRQSFTSGGGSYRVTLKAAQRILHGVINTQVVSVRLDGQEIYTLAPVGTQYMTYASPFFAVSAGAHELQLVGLNPQGGDNTVFIDDLQWEMTAPPPSRAFQMALFPAPGSVDPVVNASDADLAFFPEGAPQPAGRSIIFLYDWGWRTPGFKNILLGYSYDWSRIAAVLIDEPYWAATLDSNKCARHWSDFSNPCEQPTGTCYPFIRETGDQLAHAASVVREISPSTRFAVNFSEPEVQWMQGGTCNPALNQPYIDVISLDKYFMPFPTGVKPYYDWIVSHRATPSQQLALIPGTFFRDSIDSPATSASLLQGFFDYADSMNQHCSLPLGPTGVTGNFDGCMVWVVAGWLGDSFHEGAWFHGLRDPASAPIAEVWRAQRAKPVRDPHVP